MAKGSCHGAEKAVNSSSETATHTTRHTLCPPLDLSFSSPTSMSEYVGVRMALLQAFVHKLVGIKMSLHFWGDLNAIPLFHQLSTRSELM